VCRHPGRPLTVGRHPIRLHSPIGPSPEPDTLSHARCRHRRHHPVARRIAAIPTRVALGSWGACGASKVRPPGAPAESPGRPECRSRRNGLGSVLIAWCRPRGPRRRWLPPALRSGSRRGRGRVGVIAERRSPQQDRTSEVVRTDSGGAPWLPTAAPPPSRRSRSPWSCSHAGTPQSATPPWFAPSHGAAITGRD